MPQEFQTSFIPKKSFDSGRGQSSGSGVFMVIGICIFLVALVLGGGVFVYEKLLTGSIETKKASLEKAKEAFDPALIKELARLDTKLSSADTLIKKHIAVSALFHLLEENTLQTVQFKSFTYDQGEEGIEVSMQGEATSFSSVALQSDLFSNNPSIRKAFFSNLALNERGYVSFGVKMIVDPALFLYTTEAEKGGSAVLDTGLLETASDTILPPTVGEDSNG
jgi:hypothetical protein